MMDFEESVILEVISSYESRELDQFSDDAKLIFDQFGLKLVLNLSPFEINGGMDEFIYLFTGKNYHENYVVWTIGNESIHAIEMLNGSLDSENIVNLIYQMMISMNYNLNNFTYYSQVISYDTLITINEWEKITEKMCANFPNEIKDHLPSITKYLKETFI